MTEGPPEIPPQESIQNQSIQNLCAQIVEGCLANQNYQLEEDKTLVNPRTQILQNDEWIALSQYPPAIDLVKHWLTTEILDDAMKACLLNPENHESDTISALITNLKKLNRKIADADEVPENFKVETTNRTIIFATETITNLINQVAQPANKVLIQRIRERKSDLEA